MKKDGRTAAKGESYFVEERVTLKAWSDGSRTIVWSTRCRLTATSDVSALRLAKDYLDVNGAWGAVRLVKKIEKLSGETVTVVVATIY